MQVAPAPMFAPQNHQLVKWPCAREVPKREKLPDFAALQRISNHNGGREEVARQTDFPAKCLGGELFCRKALRNNGLQITESSPPCYCAHHPTTERVGEWADSCNCVAKPWSGEWGGAMQRNRSLEPIRTRVSLTSLFSLTRLPPRFSLRLPIGMLPVHFLPQRMLP